jgi:hypothetical protein
LQLALVQVEQSPVVRQMVRLGYSAAHCELLLHLTQALFVQKGLEKNASWHSELLVQALQVPVPVSQIGLVLKAVWHSVLLVHSSQFPAEIQIGYVVKSDAHWVLFGQAMQPPEEHIGVVGYVDLHSELLVQTIQEPEVVLQNGTVVGKAVLHSEFAVQAVQAPEDIQIGLAEKAVLHWVLFEQATQAPELQIGWVV